MPVPSTLPPTPPPAPRAPSTRLPQRKRSAVAFSSVLLAWGLAGCATPGLPSGAGHDTTALVTPEALALPGRSAPSSLGVLEAPSGTPAAVAWWQQLDDPQLRLWVEQALQRNADVRQAAARLQALRQAEVATGSRLLPQVQAQATASRTDTGLPEAVKRAGQPDNRALRGTLEFAWEVDLFGGARAAVRGAQAERAAAAHQQQAAAQAVAAEVVRQHLLWQSARLREQWLQDALQLQEQQLALHRRRLDEGLLSGADWARLQAEVSDARAQLAAVAPAAPAAHARLQTLLHRTEPLSLALAGDTGLSRPPPLAQRPPLDALRLRPDVQAAEAQLQAEGARWDETRAALWPRILLGASLGQQDLRLNALDLAPSLYRQVVAAFTLPLLNHGRLQAQRDAQAARTAAAELQWEKAMLSTLEEVESSLALQASTRRRLSQAQETLQLRQAQQQAAEAAWREGLLDGVLRLEAQRGVIAAQLQTLEARTQDALADLQLLRATGGAGTRRNTTP